MQRSEEMIGGAGVGGVPGTSSNVPGASAGVNPSATTGDNNQNTKSESATYGVNKTVRRTSEPAGRIRRITAALLLDDLVETKQENGKQVAARRKWTAEELKQIQELGQAALGLDTARGDLISVQNISFDQPAPQVLLPPTWMERIRTTVNAWSLLLRYTVIVLLFLVTYRLVIRPIKTQAIASMKELPARKRLAVLPTGNGLEDALEGESVTAMADSPQKARSEETSSGTGTA